MSDKFSHNNNYYTQKLFLELNGWDADAAVYTLGDTDVTRGTKTIPAIRNLYVAMEDVHEYDFANKYFGGWKHWLKLCASPLIKPHINSWREELEVKIRSRNLQRMEELAASGDRQAIKYMADKAWVTQPESKRGRPSKEEKAGKLKQAVREDEALEEEWQRVMQ